MKLPNNLAEMLRKPLPPEAIKPHPTKPYLSSINSIYVTERLNDVFGIGGWKLKVDILDQQEKMVTVKVMFSVPEYEIELEQFGGNDNLDKGDALKGATTDALTKIGSYLGIGQDVWKDKKTQKTEPQNVDQTTGEIKPFKPALKPGHILLPDRSILMTGTSRFGKWWGHKQADGTMTYFKDIKGGLSAEQQFNALLPKPELEPINF